MLVQSRSAKNPNEGVDFLLSSKKKSLTVGEIDLRNFKRLRRKKRFFTEVADSHHYHLKRFKEGLRKIEERNKFKNHPPILHFWQWIEEQCDNQEFRMFDLTNVDVVLLKTPLLNGLIRLGITLLSGVAREHIERKFDYALDLKNVNSLEKGQGFAMMQSVLELQQRLNIPIMLWTETDKSTMYFERYGFRSYGHCGENGENLMLLYPNEERAATLGSEEKG